MTTGQRLARAQLRRIDSRGQVGIDFYQDKGVRLRGGSARAGLPPGSGGMRGTIKGWSSASRRRMREFLLTHCERPGWSLCGVTLTIPGPVGPPDDLAGFPSVDQFKRLHFEFCRAMVRSGGGFVWRLELQARGMPHYHGLLTLPPGPWSVNGRQYSRPDNLVRDVWLSYCDQCLPPVPFRAEPMTDGRWVILVWGDSWVSARRDCPLRSTWKNGAAREYAVDVQVEGAGRGAWLRYLQDHATKSKQDQVAAGWGRHWGVAGRSRFAELPGTSETPTLRQYARVRRWLSRLATPYHKRPGALFGRARGFTPGRGRVGTGDAVVFTSPDTVRRLLDFARELDNWRGVEV